MQPPLGGLLSYYRRLALATQALPEEDGSLLARFVRGDGTAFTAALGRHPPPGSGVCRRLLGPSPDAEDAFQATFVILAQKATSLADGRPLGPWLHKVARETALKARLQASRRRAREVLAQVEPAIVDPPELQRRELAAL